MIKNVLFILLVAGFWCLSEAAAQTTESGDIQAKISGLVSSMPGSSGDNYTEPSVDDLADWDIMFNNFLTGQYVMAAIQATPLGYNLIEFSDTPTGETYYVLEEDDTSTNYWGTYVLNPDACRADLILMAPHPRFDFNTGRQAAYCFQTLDAGFFMMSGTHRCNHSDETLCDGETTACSSPVENPFRISDMAHVTESIWQRSLESLVNNFAAAFVVQLHGFTKQASDPYVIMSNGTRITPANDPIITLRDELLAVDATLTFKIAHIDLTWDKLIALTNTNGRLINGSADPCLDDATGTAGSFLHIEQERTKLRDDVTGWDKMATALGETFPGINCLALPLELKAFGASLLGDSSLLSWTTALERNHDRFEIERSTNGIVFERVGVVRGQGDKDDLQHYTFLDAPLPGINYYRLRLVDVAGEYSFSPIVQLLYQPYGPAGIEVFFVRRQLVVRIPDGSITPLVFRLYDQLGRQVFEAEVEPGESVLFPGLLQGGIYFFQLSGRQAKRWSGRVWVPVSH